MNERIKKLAEQAGFCMWKDEPWNPGDVIDWSSRYDNELEKFAELIVKECAWLVDENDISLPYGTFGKLIKGHFGVEE
jgi:hypothetical protein